MRLILQAAKDKSAQSSASVESKQPESSQSSKVVETKELAKDLNWYLPLYKAALQGDWESARKFFDQDPDAVTAKITKVSETALHVAVGTGRAIHFVKELLELIPTDALATLRDQVGQTALHYAAIFGNVKAAQILVSKNQDLPNIHSDTLFLPIHSAALYANKDMISYLLTVTKDDKDPSPFADKSGVDLLNLVTLAEFYDLALYLVQLYPSLATLKSAAGNNALNLIAGKPSPFLRRSSLNVWQRFLYSCLPSMFGNIYSQENGRVTKNPAGGPQISSKLCCQIPFSSKFKFSGCQKFNLVLWKAIECLGMKFRFLS
ncbi:uncharacterized protein LOC111409212 isoform X3 [Olea europaea var. sylvestris]|nr:uncharacterized protein LOC111409212 isoform X3 [Olea europaea var. sylvestris]